MHKKQKHNKDIFTSITSTVVDFFTRTCQSIFEDGPLIVNVFICRRSENFIVLSRVIHISYLHAAVLGITA